MLVASNVGWWLGGILLFIIWVAIAFWPARVAARKGHSFFLFFVFSLFFFPAAGSQPVLTRARSCWLLAGGFAIGRDGLLVPTRVVREFAWTS
jgi:hypothetical protein